MNTVKQHGNHHSGTGEMLNNNQVGVVRKQFDFNCFMNF